MAFHRFPKMKGPPPLVPALGMLGVSLGVLFAFPGDTLFLGLNFLNITLILITVILGKPYVPRFEQNFILVTTLILTLGLYGIFRGFGKIDHYFLQIFEFFPATVFFYSIKLYRGHFAYKKALAMTQKLILEERVEFADNARTEFKKYPGALAAAAKIYKTVAEEGLYEAPEVLPIHIIAMQKYGQMVIFNEASGNQGEGEWFAKKANELSKALLKKSDIPPTVH